MKRLAAVTTIALGVGGVLAVSTTTRTTAGITFSNVLTKAKDGRVIKSTLVPKTNWRGGLTWIITIQHPAPTMPETLTFRAPSMKKYVFTDSVWAPFPTCVPYRVTVTPDTVLTSSGRVSTKKDSVTAKLSLCRALTVPEAAWQDSFPTSGWRFTWCGNWARRVSIVGLDSILAGRLARAPTANDSATAMREIAYAKTQPDSILLGNTRSWIKGDSLKAIVGYVYGLGVLAKNRHSNRVIVLPGAAVSTSNPQVGKYTPGDGSAVRCEAERAAYEAWTGTP